MSLNVDFDPVELLTRLATALCDDEDQVSVQSFHDDLPNEDPTEKLERGTDSNIRRSNLSITTLLTMDESKKIEVARQSLREQMNLRSLRDSRRMRRVSETLHQPLVWSLSDSRTPPNQRRITLEENPGRRAPIYQRSVSENQTPVLSRFDPRQLRTDAATISNRDSESTPVVQAPLSVVEFCDLLDRVQISRQNSTAPPQ